MTNINQIAKAISYMRSYIINGTFNKSHFTFLNNTIMLNNLFYYHRAMAKGLLPLLLMLFTLSTLHAQVLVSAVSDDIEVCYGSSTLNVSIDFAQSSYTGSQVVMTFAPGITYIPGSINLVSTNASLTITEDASSTSDSAVFNIAPANIAPGNNITFSLERMANCEAMDSSLTGGAFADTLTINVDGATYIEQTELYNVLFVNLTIVPPSAINDAVVNGTYTRTTTITNGSNACSDQIFFNLSYPSGNISLNTLSVFGNVLTPVSNSGDTLYEFVLTNQDLGVDSLLCNGEQLLLEENITVSTCASSSLSTGYAIGWGCDTSNWCTTDNYNSVVTLSTGSPSFSGHSSTRIGYVNMCTPFQIEQRFSNGGTGNDTAATMYNLSIIKQTYSSVYSALPAHINFGNATVGGMPVDSVGNSNGIYQIDLENVFTTDPDGPGGLDDVDGDGYYDDLPPGEVFKVLIDVTIDCNAYACNAVNYSYYEAGKVLYNTMCDMNNRVLSGSRITQGQSLSYHFRDWRDASYTPANVFPNQSTGIRIGTTIYRYINQFRTGNSRFVYTITLPPGTTMPASGTIGWTDGGYPSNEPQQQVPFTQVGNVVTVVSPSEKIGYMDFNFIYDCIASGGDNTIEYTFQYFDDYFSSPQCVCNENIICETITLNVVGCSGGPCTDGGLGLNFLKVRRADNSLGWTDYTMTTRQVADSISNYDLSKALYLDEIEVHSSGVQRQSFDNVHARLSLDKASGVDKLTPLNADVYWYRGGLVLDSAIAVTSFSLSNSSSSVQFIDWDLSAVLGGDSVLDGDSIAVISRYQVATNNLPTQDIQSGGSYSLYNIDSLGNIRNCNSLVPEMYLVGTRRVNGVNINYVGECNSTSPGGNMAYIARRFGLSGVKFLNEFRPGIKMDRATYTLSNNYQLDRFLFDNAHIPGGFIELPISSQTVIGNNTEYVFNIPDSLSYFDITVTNAYGMYFRPYVTASCQSAGESPYDRHSINFDFLDYYYHTALDTPVDSTLYFNNELNNIRSLILRRKPSIDLVNQSGPIITATDSDSWILRYNNPSDGRAPYNWMAIPDLAGVTIDSVVSLSTGEVIAPNLYLGGAMYHLDSIGINSNSFKDYEIFFSYNVCRETEVKVLGGWNCTEYPATPADYACGAEEAFLTFIPAETEVELLSSFDSTTPVDLCETKSYVYYVNNKGAGNIQGNSIQVSFPNGIVPNLSSFEIEYPKGSNNWQTASTPVINGNTYRFNITTHTAYPSDGLPGVLNDGGNLNLRQIGFRFDVITTCDFTVGSRFKISTTAYSACGEVVNGSGVRLNSNRININGVNKPYTFINSMDTLSTFNACPTATTLEATHTVIVPQGSPATGTTGIVEIVLPIGYEYVPSTFNCTSTICPNFDSTAYNFSGNQVLYMSVPSGMISGNSFTYTLDVLEHEDSIVACGPKVIEMITTDITGAVVCSTTTCPFLRINTGANDFQFDVEKPTLEVISISTEAVVNGTSENLTANYAIINTSSTTLQPATAVIQAYYDSNRDGTIDDNDLLLATDTISQTLLGGDTATGSLVFPVHPDQACDIYFVISEDNSCVCATAVAPIAAPMNLLNIAGLDDTICVSEGTVQIGMINNPNYSYAWSSIPSNYISYLSSTTVSNPTLSLVNETADTIVYTYYVTVTRLYGCTTNDTINIAVLPAPQVSINEDTTICNGENLTLTAIGGDTYVWSTSQTTPSITVSPSTGTNYSVTITDSSGCSKDTSVFINVSPSITAQIVSSNSGLCENAPPRTLLGSPSGGTFFGPGVSGNTFNPSAAGAGTHIISYAVANFQGCTDTVQQAIEVYASPVVSFTFGDTSICITSGVLNLSSTPPSATYSGVGVNGSQFDPNSSITGVGVYEIYASINANGCTSIDTIEITVTEAPSAPTSNGDTSYCAGSPIPTISATAPSGMVIDWYNNSTGGNLLQSNSSTYTPTAAGTYYAATRDTSGNCSSASRVAIVVTENARPSAPVSGGDVSICIDDSPGTLSVTTQGGNTITWYSDAALTVNVGTGTSYTTSTAGTYYAIASNANGCTSEEATTVALTIDTLPTSVNAGVDQELCAVSAGTVTVTLAATGNGGTGEWTQIDANPSIGLTGSSNPNQQVSVVEGNTYVLEWCVNNGSCTVCDTTEVAVSTAPSFTLAPTGPSCAADLLTYMYDVTVDVGTVTSTQGTITGTAPNYTVTGVPTGVNDTLISINGICTDTLYITAPDCTCPLIAPPTSGGDQSACIDAGTWPTISASTTGNYVIDWYDVSNGGTALSSASTTYSPTIALVAGQVCYYAEARDSVTSCVSSSRTQVCITIDSLPISDAGVDTTFEVAIGNTVNYDLDASASGGVGEWQQLSGPSVGINGSSNATPTIVVEAVNTYNFEWCVSNANCEVCDTVTISTIYANQPPVAVNDDTTTLEDTPVDIDVLTNDNDVEGPLDSTSVSITSTPSNGTVSVDSTTGVITYTPNDDFVGEDEFTYMVCDTGIPVLCDTAVVTVVIESVIDTVYTSTPEDTPVTTCTDSLTNFENPITSVTTCSTPNDGTITPGLLPCLTYTPDTDYVGNDTVCVVSCSGTYCDTTIWIIEVTPVNDPPIAVNDVDTTEEDTPVDVDVLANDYDTDGPIDSTSVSVTSNPTNGTVSVDPVTGVITYTPDNDFVGVDVFTYAVCDTGMPVLCDTAQVTIYIESVNDTVYTTTFEEVPDTICMDSLSNFENPISTVNICGFPNDGTLSNNLLPCVVYTPTTDYVGMDTMCIITCAGSVCDTTIWIIDVLPVNDPPIAVDDAETTPEDTPVDVDVLANDYDIDGPIDSTSVSVTSNPTNGTVSVDPVTGVVTYTPDSNFVGVDVFTYAVCDTGMPVLCDTAQVTITVVPTPDTTYVTTPEDTPVTVCLDSLVNFGSNSSINQIGLCENPSNGTITNVFNCVTYTPTPNYVGEDSLCVISCNSDNVCDTTYIIITVTPVNDPPVAVDDTETTPEDTPVDVDVLANDYDIDGPIDSTSVSVTSNPTNGTVSVDSVTGVVTYTPDSNFVGVDVFTYAVCDTGMPVLCDTAQVTITVVPTPDTTYVTTPEDTPVTVCLDSLVNLGNGVQIDAVSVCDGPENGTISLAGGLTPCVSYEPDSNFYGMDSICLVSCSDVGVCDTTIIIIEVTPVVDVPILVAIDDICETESYPSLEGSSEALSTINWYDSNDNLLGTGDSVGITTVNLGLNCFYAVAIHDTIANLMSDTAEVCFMVDSLPDNVYAGPDDTICGFIDYELQATGDGNNNAWTQIIGTSVALDFSNPNAIVSLQPQNSSGQSNNYTFVWTNQNGLCSVSDTVTIISTTPHITNAGNDTTICIPQTGGSIELNASLSPLGVGHWEYVGAGNIAFADSTDPQTTVSGLVPYVNPSSDYRFYWYEQIGECVARDEVIVTINEAAEIIGLADADTNCLHSDYTLTADVTAINAPGYSWRIGSPTGVVVSENMDGVVSPQENTVYYVVATTVFGSNICRSIDSITINVDGMPMAADDGCYELTEDSLYTGNTSDWLSNDDNSAVITGEVAFEVLSASIMTPPSMLAIDNATGEYIYTPGADVSGNDTATVIAYNVACEHLRDTFRICYSIAPVVDSPIVAVNDTVQAIAEVPIDISIFDNDSLNEQAVTTTTTILTDPSYGTVSVIDSANGIVNYVSGDNIAHVDSFQYIVCQTLADGEALCDTAWVFVYIDGDIYIPEGFTPNGDGVNDGFVIPDLDRLYPDATLKVYNRWGDEVWNSQTPYRNNFVGENFEGNQLPDGTYFYILELNDGSGRKKASYVVIYR